VSKAADRREAADVLRGLLEAVEEGKLSASTAEGRRMLRRIEGAVVALEAGKRESQ
jgi:hypothetical protein